MKYLWLSVLLISFSVMDANAQKTFIYVGTYTEDIGVYCFDRGADSLRFVEKYSGIRNPSYLAIAPDGKALYAVSETNKSLPGSVVALSINPKGGLKFLNEVPSMGDDPCHIDAIGGWVAVGNYSGGNFSLYQTEKNGSLQPFPRQIVDHEGHGINSVRQEKPHVHMVRFSKSNNSLWVNDLGTDKTYCYPFDPKGDMPIDMENATEYEATPGSGPRHLEFHPQNNTVYSINELSGTVDVISDGRLVQSVDYLYQKNKDNGAASADIHITSDGRYLYVTHRAAGLIDCYAVDEDGMLSLIESVNCGGVNPRNFCIMPDDRHLLVANQDSNNIVIFAINPQNGKLRKLNHEVKIEKPVCIKTLVLD